MYSGSVTAAAPTTANPLMDFQNPLVDSARLFVFELCVTAAGAGTNYGLGRGTVASVQRNPTYCISEEFPGRVSTTSMATAWYTAPSAPSTFFRRIFTNNAFSSTATVLTFPRGLSVTPSNIGTSLWAIAAAGVPGNFIVNAVIDG